MKLGGQHSFRDPDRFQGLSVLGWSGFDGRGIGGLQRGCKKILSERHVFAPKTWMFATANLAQGLEWIANHMPFNF